MNKRTLKIIEISSVCLFSLALFGFALPTMITNVKKARVNASYLGAKAYYEEYLSYNHLDSLDEGKFIYYNDGHLYWVIDSEGNIAPDENNHEKTPLKR